MPEEVASAVALSFSPEAVHLHYRHAEDWEEVDHVRFDDPDLRAGLVRLRDHARNDGGDSRAVQLIIPEDQLLYTRLDVDADGPVAMPGAIGRALEGLTPYRVEELAFDWLPAGPGAVHVAVVSRQTLAEAEEFATGNGFDVAGFIAVPDTERFPGEPDFTDSALDEDGDALAAPQIDEERLAHSLDRLRALTAARTEAPEAAPATDAIVEDRSESPAPTDKVTGKAQGAAEKPADFLSVPSASRVDPARLADAGPSVETADTAAVKPTDAIAPQSPEAAPFAPIISHIPASVPYAIPYAAPAAVAASEAVDKKTVASPDPAGIRNPVQPVPVADSGAAVGATDMGKRRLAAPASEAQPAITRHAGRDENALIRHVPPAIRALFTGPHGALVSLLTLLLVGMLAIALFSGQGNRAGDDPLVLAQDEGADVSDPALEAAESMGETGDSAELGPDAADGTPLAEAQPEVGPLSETAGRAPETTLEAELDTADEALTATADIGDDMAPLAEDPAADEGLLPSETLAEGTPEDIPAALAGLSPMQRPDLVAESATPDQPDHAGADQVQADADDALGNALRQALAGGEAGEADDSAARIAMISPVSTPPAATASPEDRAMPASPQSTQTAPAAQENAAATGTGLSQARRPRTKPTRPATTGAANRGETPQAAANPAALAPPSRPAGAVPAPPAAESTRARAVSSPPAARPASRPAATTPAANPAPPPVATASGQGRLQRSTRPPSRPMRSGAVIESKQPQPTRLTSQDLTPPITDRAAFLIPVEVIRTRLPAVDEGARRYAQARPSRRPGAVVTGGTDGQAVRNDAGPADAPPPVRPAAAASTAASTLTDTASTQLASAPTAAPAMRPARKPGNAGVDSAAVQEAVSAALAADEGAKAAAPARTTAGLRSSMAPPQRSAAFVANTAPRPDAAAAAASIQAPAQPPAAPVQQPAPSAAADAAAEQSRLEADLQAQAEARIRARADADTQAEARARAEAEARARAAAEAEERAARARGGSYRPAEVDNEPELIAAATGSASQVAAKNATIAGALNPRRTTLIGVVGAGKTSRGLIRLRNGKVVTVRVGDKIDGGPITAIGDGAVTYTVGGRARQLKILDGR